MRLFSGKKFGQSRYELALASLFSLFLHAALVALALIIRMAITPRVYVPPSYTVKLVGLPQDLTTPPAGRAAPEPPKVEPKPEPKAKKTPAKTVKAVPKKSGMPELDRKKSKPAPEEEAKPEPAQPPAPPSAETTGTAAKGVGVPSSSDEFKFPPYLAIVREKIERNWNPPPGVAGLKSTVQFSILRSGRVEDVTLKQASGNFYFDQASMRAILLSNPFPPMPDGFYKDFEMFSVDLMEKQ